MCAVFLPVSSPTCIRFYSPAVWTYDRDSVFAVGHTNEVLAHRVAFTGALAVICVLIYQCMRAMLLLLFVGEVDADR
jgi:hypothetical protein